MADLDGKFSIQAATGDKLRFSYTGYGPDLVLGAETTLNVVLEQATILLDELVVVGYGKAKKSDLRLVFHFRR